MTETGAISVMIPCYNDAAFVGEAIESALQQTLLPDEVIVVDDGSSDNSAAVATAYGPLVRVIRQEHRGLAAARHAGVLAAIGSWIAFLDADDLWTSQRLERLARVAASAEPDVVCIFNDLSYVWPDGTWTARPTPVHLLDRDAHVNLLCDWLVNPSALLVRADVARTIPFVEGVSHVEDLQFLALLSRRGRFVHLPETCTGYRRRPGQLTADPRHLLIAAREILAFLRQNALLYSAGDVARVRARYVEGLAWTHDRAYRKRQYDIVREIRELYVEVHPDPDPTLPRPLPDSARSDSCGYET